MVNQQISTAAPGVPSTLRDLAGSRLLITGHTGFCGSWAGALCEALGIEAHGYSRPDDDYFLHERGGAGQFWASQTFGDVHQLDLLSETVRSVNPDYILHLAAQPLVRRSYQDPVESFRTNILGTAHTLQAAIDHEVAGVVAVTTDKVYEDANWVYGYRENDRLGGKDPYSASKAGAEIVISSYRESLAVWGSATQIASARGGNVVGGGDYALDRLIPDVVRAHVARRPIRVRYPDAVRPWQHVLCLLHGYLTLMSNMRAGRDVAGAWNFGPASSERFRVQAVLDMARERWPEIQVESDGEAPPETHFLALDSSKAMHELEWTPGWSTLAGLTRTLDWYGHHLAGEDPALLVRRDVADYLEISTS